MKAVSNFKDALKLKRLEQCMRRDIKVLSKNLLSNMKVQGNITIHYSGYSVEVFDKAVASLIDYSVWNRNVHISDGFSVSFVLD